MDRQGRSRFATRFFVTGASVGVILLCIAVLFYLIFYLPFVKAPADLARSTADGIRELFNFTPRVKIAQTVIIEQNTPILEVATVSRTLHVEHSWSHSWLGSTKLLQLRGTFQAKAGFDLREPFEVRIEDDPLRVVASLPPPHVLSVEMQSYTLSRDESGWWNRISDADREAAVRNLVETARRQAETSGILEEAVATAEQRIRDMVERNGSTVEFDRHAMERGAETGE